MYLGVNAVTLPADKVPGMLAWLGSIIKPTKSGPDLCGQHSRGRFITSMPCHGMGIGVMQGCWWTQRTPINWFNNEWYLALQSPWTWLVPRALIFKDCIHTKMALKCAYTISHTETEKLGIYLQKLWSMWKLSSGGVLHVQTSDGTHSPSTVYCMLKRTVPPAMHWSTHQCRVTLQHYTFFSSDFLSLHTWRLPPIFLKSNTRDGTGPFVMSVCIHAQSVQWLASSSHVALHCPQAH